jgi:LCP family protein required for cell wall assembly
MYEPPEDSPNERASSARGKGATHAARSGREPERPYKVYRSAPRGLIARLRGESDAELEARAEQLSRQKPPRASAVKGGRGAGSGSSYGDPYGDPYGAPGGGGAGGLGGAGGGGAGDGGGGYGPGAGGGRRRPRFALFGRRRGLPRRPPFHPIRLIKYAILAVIAWVVLSAVLFFISAETNAGNLPGGQTTLNALSSSGPILVSPNNILILGLDVRPHTGYSSQEKGANYSEADANTDSIMIWRVGGLTSRRLSIPRDTWVNIPGHGYAKINAAWSEGGPALTIKVVEQMTGIKINHMIVVDFANFTKFIDDIGGVNVYIPHRLCSNISGGAQDGGYTLDVSRGNHRLNGTEALTLARSRENSCDAAWDDYQRQAMQQRIINAIRGQLFTPHTFFHLPWASWDAPKVLQTDMGPLQLMQLFISSELGGSAKPETLKQVGGYIDGQDVQLPTQQNINQQVNKLLNG